jgi:hypothetical protein
LGRASRPFNVALGQPPPAAQAERSSAATQARGKFLQHFCNIVSSHWPVENPNLGLRYTAIRNTVILGVITSFLLLLTSSYFFPNQPITLNPSLSTTTHE